MELDLRKYLMRAKYGKSDELTYPTILANAVKYLHPGIQVNSSKNIGKGFNTFDGEEILHDNCRPSSSQSGEGQQRIENVAETVGRETVRFLYDYKKTQVQAE